MFKKHSHTNYIILCAHIGCLLFFVSCKENIEKRVDNNKIDTITIDTSIFSKHFEMPVNANSLTYVRLETNIHSLINHVSQIKIFNDIIYILDQSNNKMLLFDIFGKFINDISVSKARFQSFDVWNNNLYVQDKYQGKIFKFDAKGKLLKILNIGFHGVQFSVFDEECFVFNTAGFLTKDRNSEDYQLAIVKKDHSYMRLPFKKILTGLKYCFENQFSKNEKKTEFISAFDNLIFNIDTSEVKAVTKLNFGKYNMPDSVFLKGKHYDNFNALPYTSELSNTCNTTDFSFFKFSFNSNQGYLLIDKKRKKVISGGIGFIAGQECDFKNIIPECSYKEMFIAVLKPKDILAMPADISRNKSRFSKQNDISDLKPTDNPVLLFYHL